MSYESLIGLSAARESSVTEKNTALALKSGSLKVLATPEMIRLIEETSAELVEQNLPRELTSVGISLNVKHTAPTPVGMKFRAEAKIVSVDGRKIVLDVAAVDERGQIGNGTHERFIVDRKKFQLKADEKPHAKLIQTEPHDARRKEDCRPTRCLFFCAFEHVDDAQPIVEHDRHAERNCRRIQVIQPRPFRQREQNCVVHHQRRAADHAKSDEFKKSFTRHFQTSTRRNSRQKYFSRQAHLKLSTT